MKNVSALILGLAMAFSAQAGNKVIYGEDNRLDLFETGDALHAELAQSTAAMIAHSRITLLGDKATITGSPLSSRGICASEPFANQITAANCSGFLVGKDLLVTAGHCVKNSFDCSGSAWVFGFGVNSPDQQGHEIPATEVYRCAEVIETVLDRATSDDYALIRLDRAVTGRSPLKVRTDGKITEGTEIVVIGHPTGLPTKVAAGANVRDNSDSYFFVANLDTYGGNSGSAVFDAKTGTVEGILVRGENDYVYDSSQGCQVSNHCTNEGCRGEDVTRITNVKKLQEILAAEANQ
jgi:V8-like Glu-specific endopeptidase